MSKLLAKSEFKCTCGKNYGDCGEIGTFFLYYQGPVDLYHLLIRHHPGEPVRSLGVFTEEAITALIHILEDNGKLPSPDEVERKEVWDAMGFISGK